jgi:hypothetical protein
MKYKDKGGSCYSSFWARSGYLASLFHTLNDNIVTLMSKQPRDRMTPRLLGVTSDGLPVTDVHTCTECGVHGVT